MEKILFSSGGETISAELFLPDRKQFAPPYPGLIAIHEWWGLNDQVRGEAKRLASEGFAVLAVDLYRGRLAADAEEAHELMRGLPQDRAIQDMRAAFGRLSAHPDVWPGRIGAIGWCMGGGFSLELAAAEPNLEACVIYYGRLITDTARLSKIRAAVYGFFGEADRGIPPDSVRAFEQQMKKIQNVGYSPKIHMYPGAGHAFANATRPSYNDTAAKDAWSNTIRYLKSCLDDAILRIAKREEHGDTDLEKSHRAGDRIVYTIWIDNDGNSAPDSLVVAEYFDSNLVLDLSRTNDYGDIFTDSGMPTWGGTFDVILEYCLRQDMKPDKRMSHPKCDENSFRPLTRQTPVEAVGGVQWTFYLTGGDSGISEGRNVFVGPDNRNDDRRKMDDVDTSFGAKPDIDAAYVRFAARLK